MLNTVKLLTELLLALRANTPEDFVHLLYSSYCLLRLKVAVIGG